MEGSLYKWTGYISGWNTQFFVLTDGTLCCYSTKMQRKNGSPPKESISMGLCEIVLDQTSSTQWELRMPVVSKVWYLRAESSPERQQWIKALGSSKACLLDFGCTESRLSLEHTISLHGGDAHHLTEEDSSKETSSLNESTVSVSAAESENGSECMNKLTASKNLLKIDGKPDVEKLFLQCQETTEQLNKLSSFLSAVDDQQLLLTHLDQTSSSMQRLSAVIEGFKSQSLHRLADSVEETNQITYELIGTSTPHAVMPQINVGSFFSTRETNFCDVATTITFHNGEALVPTDIFLNACQCFVSFFEKFAGTTLSPLKTDVQSNIDKIRKVISKDTSKFKYLQEILEADVSAKTHTGPDSGTQALLWLTRSFRVLSKFLKNLLSKSSISRKDTVASFLEAYTNLLADNHNWFVQRLFKLGLKMIPSYDDFVKSMTNRDSWEAAEKSGNPAWRDGVEKELGIQTFKYVEEMDDIVEIICKMYLSYKMEV